MGRFIDYVERAAQGLIKAALTVAEAALEARQHSDAAEGITIADVEDHYGVSWRLLHEGDIDRTIGDLVQELKEWLQHRTSEEPSTEYMTLLYELLDNIEARYSIQLHKPEPHLTNRERTFKVQVYNLIREDRELLKLHAIIDGARSGKAGKAVQMILELQRTREEIAGCIRREQLKDAQKGGSRKEVRRARFIVEHLEQESRLRIAEAELEVILEEARKREKGKKKGLKNQGEVERLRQEIVKLKISSIVAGFDVDDAFREDSMAPDIYEGEQLILNKVRSHVGNQGIEWNAIEDTEKQEILRLQDTLESLQHRLEGNVRDLGAAGTVTESDSQKDNPVQSPSTASRRSAKTSTHESAIKVTKLQLKIGETTIKLAKARMNLACMALIVQDRESYETRVTDPQSTRQAHDDYYEVEIELKRWSRLKGLLQYDLDLLEGRSRTFPVSVARKGEELDSRETLVEKLSKLSGDGHRSDEELYRGESYVKAEIVRMYSPRGTESATSSTTRDIKAPRKKHRDSARNKPLRSFGHESNYPSSYRDELLNANHFYPTNRTTSFATS